MNDERKEPYFVPLIREFVLYTSVILHRVVIMFQDDYNKQTRFLPVLIKKIINSKRGSEQLQRILLYAYGLKNMDEVVTYLYNITMYTLTRAHRIVDMYYSEEAVKVVIQKLIPPIPHNLSKGFQTTDLVEQSVESHALLV